MYNTALLLLYPVYRILALFMPKLRSFQKSRKDIEKFYRFLETEKRRFIWLHASSVGEQDQALALIREIKKHHTDLLVVLSIFSTSVKNMHREEPDLMFYLPLDLPWAWKKLHTLLAKSQCQAYATMTWDVFPNLQKRLISLNIPIFLCSAALGMDSYRLRHLQFFRPLYQHFSGIGAVDQDNAERFQRFFATEEERKRVSVTGDSRFDSIFHKIENSPLKPEIDSIIKTNRPVWILASTYQACEEQIIPELPSLLKDFPDWQIWIFPHHIDQSRLQSIEKKLEQASLTCIRLSNLTKNDSPLSDPKSTVENEPGKGTEAENHRILLFDALGILALAYRYAQMTYIGGAFHHRVHNTGEPAAFSLPMMSGPLINDSPVAVDLNKIGVLKTCKNGQEILHTATNWAANSMQRKDTGINAKKYMENQKGASHQFYNTFLKELIESQN